MYFLILENIKIILSSCVTFLRKESDQNIVSFMQMFSSVNREISQSNSRSIHVISLL